MLFDGMRAVGVEAERDGRLETHLGDEVVLCASGLKSPHMLLLSGIGPADDLRAHRIDVVHDSPGVGRNAKDHPALFLAFRLNDGGGRPPVHVPLFDVLLNHTAPGSPTAGDLQIMCGAAPMFEDTLMLVVSLEAEKSAGEIRLASADPADPPRIHLGYLSDPDDLPRLAASMRVAVDILRSPEFERLGVERIDPSDEVTASDESLEAWILANLGTLLHTTGTARMGPASTRRPSSTSTAACTGSRGCGWSTSRSCRRSSGAAPPRRP